MSVPPSRGALNRDDDENDSSRGATARNPVKQIPTATVAASFELPARETDDVSKLEAEIGTMLNSLAIDAETVRAYGRFSIALGEKMVKYASHVKYNLERPDNNKSDGDQRNLRELSSQLGLTGLKAMQFGSRLNSQIAASRLAMIEDVYHCTKRTLDKCTAVAISRGDVELDGKSDDDVSSTRAQLGDYHSYRGCEQPMPLIPRPRSGYTDVKLDAFYAAVTNTRDETVTWKTAIESSGLLGKIGESYIDAVTDILLRTLASDTLAVNLWHMLKDIIATSEATSVSERGPDRVHVFFDRFKNSAVRHFARDLLFGRIA